jgi:hypothetical protein
MRSTTRLFALAALLALFALATVPVARGQLGMRMSTVVDNMVGEGGDAPQVRMIFQEKDEDLCLTMAVLTGPTALRAQLFRFSRRVEGEPKSQQIRFDLPKKPESLTQKGHRLQVYEGCLKKELDPVPNFGPPVMIDIRYRDPRLLAAPAEHALAFPTAESPQGVDVLKDSAGNLLFQSYRPSSEELL